MWNVEKCDVIDLLSKNRVIRKETQAALRVAFAHNGYVSGGFSRCVAAAVLSGRDILTDKTSKVQRKSVGVRYDSTHTWDSVVSYLGSLNKMLVKTEKGRFWKSNCGDIDVFFPTKNDAEVCIHHILRSNLSDWDSPTLAGYGHEFLIGENIVQLLSRVNGTPHEVVGSFDISNAKVYFDAAGVHYTDEWIELEESRLLGISTCTKPNLLWRVKKWFNKHGYSDFAPGDQEKYVDAILNAAKMVKSRELKRWGDVVKIQTVQSHGKMFTHILAPRDLLRLSLIYDTYDQLQILKHIAERAS